MAIGQLALWYLPGDWKTKQRDPFGLGPHIAKVAPWLVPDQISGAPSSPLTPDNGDQSNGDTDNNGAGGGSSNGTGGGLAINDVPDLGTVGMNDNGQDNGQSKKKKRKGKGNNAKNNGARPQPSIDPTNTEPEDPTAPLDLTDNGNSDPTDPSIDVPNIADPLATIGEPPAIDDPLATIGEPPKIDDPLATVGEPTPETPPAATPKPADDLVTGINAAREAQQRIINEWADLGREEKIAAGKAYYNQLANVARALHAMGPDNKVARNRQDEVRELLQGADTNQAPRDMIYYFGSEQMDIGEAGPVVLYGIIQSMGKVDDQPILRLELKGGGTALVLCPGPHNGTYEKGKGLFLYGVRLSDDEHEYDDPQVVKASVLKAP